MENQNQVVLYEQPKKVGTYQLLKNAGYIAIVTALTAPAAYAGDIDTIGQAANSEISSGKAVVITLLTTAVVILGLLAGWRYLKRGINSA